MSADGDAEEERFVALLAACDDALAEGKPPLRLAGADAAPELLLRVENHLSCLHLLRRLLPREPTTEHGPTVPDAALWGLDLGRPAVWFGRFHIQRELGRGGFGIVLLADDPLLGRQVALKVPRAGGLMNPAMRERFLREAKATARLDHPNVASVYEAGAVGPICYIVSAYCPGPNLAVWLKGRSELTPVRTAALWTAAVAEGVRHAHSQGVLHRDVKPSNILLAPRRDGVSDGDDQGFTPRLTDFGLAKLLEADGDHTATGVIVGTAPYMAPEQAEGRNEAVGPATDVYALGAILYELLTGRPPLLSESLLATLEQVRSGAPTPLRRLRVAIPADLETICLKCLHKNPKDRYAGAGALADDLRRFLAGESIQARPLRWLDKAWNWCRRPERIRDAAVVAVIATAFDILMSVLPFLLMLSGQLPEINGFWPATAFFLALLCGIGLPMIWITRRTLARDVYGLWAGAVVPILVTLFLLTTLAGFVDTGGMVPLQDRTMALSSVSMATTVQSVQAVSFLLALIAYYADRSTRP